MDNPRMIYGCAATQLSDDAVFLLEAAGIYDGVYKPIYITDHVNEVPLDRLTDEERKSFEAQRQTLNQIVVDASSAGVSEIHVIGVAAPAGQDSPALKNPGNSLTRWLSRLLKAQK